jgi:hypothetical protein
LGKLMAIFDLVIPESYRPCAGITRRPIAR